MKKIVLVLAVLGSAIFYSACSNDIDLVAEWKDIPVVYGFISATDTANNLIRVEKAFLDNSKSALEIAQVADSLYYENVTVRLKNVAIPSESYVLDRVDGNAIGYPREEGIFANAPNYLYKLKGVDGALLNADNDYQLEINRGDNLPVVTATATILDEIDLRSPVDYPINSDAISWYNLLRVEWRTKPTAHIFDAKLFLHIEEKDLANPANDRILTLEWKIMENEPAIISGIGTTEQVRMITRITGRDLYQYLNSHLVENPGIARKFLSFDILIIGGGEAFSDYISAGNANTGITSTQVIPTYTNLSEGFGIFSSKNSLFLEGYEIDNVTVDSLQNNPLTKDFNFN